MSITLAESDQSLAVAVVVRMLASSVKWKTTWLCLVKLHACLLLSASVSTRRCVSGNRLLMTTRR